MRGEQNLKEAIKQNLVDSGCNKKQIEDFFKLYEENNKEQILKMLKAHKENLLKKLRTDKRKIDDLDYLIIDIQNNFKNWKEVRLWTKKSLYLLFL